MKKLIKIGVTFLLSICCLTPLNVKANDDEYIKTITVFSEEYPLYMTNPDIQTFAISTDNYTYNPYYYTNKYTYFESSFNCTPSTLYPMLYQIWLKESIGKGTTIDLDLQFSTNMDASNVFSIEIQCKDFSDVTFQKVYGTFKQNGASNFVISFDNIQLTDNLKRIDLYFGLYSSSGVTSSTMVLNSIQLNKASETMQVGQILSWLEILNTRLEIINTNISTTVSSVRVAIEEGFNQIGSAITNHTLAIQNHITQSFNSLNTWINNQTTTISNKLNEVINAIRGDNKIVESKPNLENSTNDLDNTINEYDDIESGLVEDFNTNIGAIKPNNNLITNNDFIKTSTFVATQMTRIYESNSIIQMTITFGLIIGLAFTIIGISVKR